MARVLSIDYGKKRTGIAVTDPLQIIANGLVTVPTSGLLPFLADYVKKEQVERIIVGEPLQMNGQPSDNHGRVMQFVDKWRRMQPGIPVEMVDERFTSVLAHKTMLESGIGKMARRNKALVDEISATIILQSYLESRKFRT